MALQLKINTVDRSSWISWPSLSWEEGLTKEPDLLEFALNETPSKTPLPAQGDDVEFYLDGVLKFTGKITEKVLSNSGGLLLTHTYKCKDRTHDLDKKLVAKVWENMTAEDIADDILTLFTDGTFTLNVQAGSPTLETFRANYEPVTKTLQRLADIIGWDWYVDENSVVQIFPALTYTAPATIEDDNASHIAGSLQFNTNILELKNSIIVQGGQFKNAVDATDTPDIKEADGDQRTFFTIYRYAEGVEVTVNGVAKTVGTDNLHDPDDYDVLYNFQEKAVKFRENNKPTAGQIVKVFGDQLIDLLTQVIDSTSIAAYEERQYLLKNESITSIEEAFSAAKAVIDKWASGSSEGSFRTRTNGFRPGQTLTVDSTAAGITESYKISKVTARAISPTALEYTVAFLQSGQVTFVDMMVGLLGVSATITDSTAIRRLQLISEGMTISDAIGTPTRSSPPYVYDTALYGFSTYS